MPPPRSAGVLSQMWCVNIAMSTHAPCWRRPARRRRDWLIMCQSCNAFCINQRKEAKNARVQEGHLMADHVHMLLSIPPKYSVAQVVGFIKGKAAIHIARTFMGRRKNSTGHHFWARGYYVSTV